MYGTTLCNYAKVNGIKYYLVEDEEKDKIIYILNGVPVIQYEEGNSQFDYWKNLILNNNSAKQYYKDAAEFTEWFKTTV